MAAMRVVLLFLSLLAIAQAVGNVYQYNCTVCIQKGYHYCADNPTQTPQWTSGACYGLSQDCAITNTQKLLTLAQCPYVTPTCSDYTGNCAGCLAASPSSLMTSCHMCISTGPWCVDASIPIASECPSFAVQITSAAQCTGATVAPAVACASHTTCDTCLAPGNKCQFCAQPSQNLAAGCMSNQTGACTYAATSCTDPLALCPTLSNTYYDRCKCTANPECAVCYDVTSPDMNFLCTTVHTPQCQSIYNNCTAPALVCSQQINSDDPYGTRCDCVQNPACSICLPNAPNELVIPQMQCISAANPPAGSYCNLITNDCNHPKLICPTRLTCSECQKSTGCQWCESGSTTQSSSCAAATDTCPEATQQIKTCSNCYTHSDCPTCSTATEGCQWCAGDNGKAQCVKTCNVTYSPPVQHVVTNCSAVDKCNQYKTCATCAAVPGCYYCEGLQTIIGQSPGRYCTSVVNCNNPNPCGFWNPCLSYPHSNNSCTGTSTCGSYTTCSSCIASPVITQQCFWCDNGSGTRYCDVGCSPGVRVADCKIFGGLSATGATGTVATGSNGLAALPPSSVTSSSVGGSTGSTSATSAPSSGAGTSGTSAGSGTGTVTSGTPAGAGTSGTPTGAGTSGTPTGAGTSGTPAGAGTSGTPAGSGTGVGTSGSPTGTVTAGVSTSGAPTGSVSGAGTSGTPAGAGTSGTPAGSGTGVATGAVSSGTPAGSVTGAGTGGTPAGSGTGTVSGTGTGSGTAPDGSGSGNSDSNSTASPTNGGILGDGKGVIGGFDWVLFAIIMGIVLLCILIIVIVVIVVKRGSGTEQA